MYASIWPKLHGFQYIITNDATGTDRRQHGEFRIVKSETRENREDMKKRVRNARKSTVYTFECKARERQRNILLLLAAVRSGGEKTSAKTEREIDSNEM